MQDGIRRAWALIVVMAGGAGAAPAHRAVDRDACDLLTAQDIQLVQPSTIDERRRSEESTGQLRFQQCFYQAARFEHSVSLTLITRADSASPEVVRAYWDLTFVHPARTTRRPAPGRTPREKQPPRPIEGAGGDAYWTGDDRAGALYVLSGDAIVRISVGGVQDEEVRIARSRTLARAALARLMQRAG